jgi:hypothetical protein
LQFLENCEQAKLRTFGGTSLPSLPNIEACIFNIEATFDIECFDIEEIFDIGCGKVPDKGY